MNKQLQFVEYRERYPEFHYKSYQVRVDDEALWLNYEFEIPGLAEFHPELKIPKKQLPLVINDDLVQNLAFQLGMVELISYWKCTCAPKVVVECGRLDAEQVSWWRKLYYYGLGELFYRNEIETTQADFMRIECINDAPEIKIVTERADLSGNLVLVGGGKDSVVTLETLGIDRARDYAMIVNPKSVTRECVRLSGLGDEHTVEIWRKIDPRLIELNSQGFINGHTPFSAFLAFSAYLVAGLLGLKYVVVSNEGSANEASVAGTDVNHQYSKSFEFEQDFRWYAEHYLGAGVEYFSFLRPLNELQIAKIFARLPQYHSVFNSCNVGSKGETWQWCNNCGKCLFAYIILAPYLYRDALVGIFGEDLFEKEALLPIFQQLIGQAETKPFDCVGTFEEVNFAVGQVAQKIQSAGGQLPYLLQYYVDAVGTADVSDDLTRRYNSENNLNVEQERNLRKAVFDAK